MRKFNSPVNLKAAADSFVSEAFIDVTLTELVSAHSIARPLLALHFRLKKWYVSRGQVKEMLTKIFLPP